MAGKRKTLPKDFDKLVKVEDFASLRAIFDKCDVNAYGGYAKQSAIGFNNCSDELTVWLVENGADIHHENTYGDTPIHLRGTSHEPNIDILVKLGGDVNRLNKNGNTPLHNASGYQRIKSVVSLLNVGAKTDVQNLAGLTPLEHALYRCSNIDIINMQDLSKVFFNHGVEITPSMKEMVKKIGVKFEFHRDGFNKDSVDEFSNALDCLYELYSVSPVHSRVIHDGVTVINISAGSWEQQYENLWDYLIPSNGAALTVQGEVIRISGRISDEVLRNCGGNWDRDFRKMCTAFIKHIQSGNALHKDDVSNLKELLSDFELLMVNTNLLQKSALKWVSKNINPLKLSDPNYKR
ncbi:MAG: hypothetical protein GY787_24790 [Alteromonadales bacterium]|nr:hypothetical protein [Alteromonadales bacterium]